MPALNSVQWCHVLCIPLYGYSERVGPIGVPDDPLQCAVPIQLTLPGLVRVCLAPVHACTNQPVLNRGECLTCGRHRLAVVFRCPQGDRCVVVPRIPIETLHAVRPENYVRSCQISGTKLGFNLCGWQPAGFCVPERLVLRSIFRHYLFYCVDQLQCCFRWLGGQVEVVSDCVDVLAALAEKFWQPFDTGKAGGGWRNNDGLGINTVNDDGGFTRKRDQLVDAARPKSLHIGLVPYLVSVDA